MTFRSRRSVLGGVIAAGLGLGASFSGAARAQARALRVGVTAGPHAQILEVVAREAREQGLEIRIVEFNDFVQPNAALANGDLDANSYQNQPFLDQQNEDRRYNLVAVGKTVIFPMGIYSRKVARLEDLPRGARIGIPNDPTNGGRALHNFAAHGVLRLRPDAGFRATVADIVENPKNVRVVEIEAAQLPRALPDLDAAAINTNFAVSAGLDPNRDAIAREDVKGPYANLIVVRAADRDRPEIATLVRVYQSDPVRRFIDETFRGALVVAW
jgi:D-methionine transport system substrate-binding protein